MKRACLSCFCSRGSSGATSGDTSLKRRAAARNGVSDALFREEYSNSSRIHLAHLTEGGGPDLIPSDAASGVASASADAAGAALMHCPSDAMSASYHQQYAGGAARSLVSQPPNFSTVTRYGGQQIHFKKCPKTITRLFELTRRSPSRVSTRLVHCFRIYGEKRSP